MIENAIYARLTMNAGFAGLIGDRLYPVDAPGSGDDSNASPSVARPYVVYFLVSSPEERTIDGASGIVRSRYQFDVYADTFGDARAGYHALRSALNDWTGTLDGTTVLGSYKETDSDLVERDVTPKLFRTTVDFILTHTE